MHVACPRVFPARAVAALFLGALACLPDSAEADTLIDTTPAWDGRLSYDAFGEGPGAFALCGRLGAVLRRPVLHRPGGRDAAIRLRHGGLTLTPGASTSPSWARRGKG